MMRRDAIAFRSTKDGQFSWGVCSVWRKVLMGCIELVTSALDQRPRSKLLLGNHDDCFLRMIPIYRRSYRHGFASTRHNKKPHRSWYSRLCNWPSQHTDCRSPSRLDSVCLDNTDGRRVAIEFVTPDRSSTPSALAAHLSYPLIICSTFLSLAHPETSATSLCGHRF